MSFGPLHAECCSEPFSKTFGISAAQQATVSTWLRSIGRQVCVSVPVICFLSQALWCACSRNSSSEMLLTTCSHPLCSIYSIVAF